MRADDRYYWARLLILIGGGVAVALQIGKVPAALPFLQADLGLSLVTSGWVVSIFGLIAALLAAFVGALADRLGQLRAALIGLTLTACAALAGSQAETGATLLTLRVVEGIGYLLTATSIPPLILRMAPEHRRASALALWGLFVPFGSFLMMGLSGPVLEHFDWRALWILTGAMILAASIPFFLVGRTIPRTSGTSAPDFRHILRAAGRRAPLLGCATFATYASQYFIVTGFLPLILIDLDGVSPLIAASLGAVVILCNASGILIGGWLLARGVRASTLILVGGGIMGLFSLLIFNTALPVEIRIAAAIGFAPCAALVPSSLFSSIPKLAGDPAAISTMSGLLAQGSGIGQLAGPPLAAALVAATGGWWAAIPVMLVLSSGTVLCGLALRRYV